MQVIPSHGISVRELWGHPLVNPVTVACVHCTVPLFSYVQTGAWGGGGGGVGQKKAINEGNGIISDDCKFAERLDDGG